MSINKRVCERFKVRRNVNLISPCQKKITATVANVSLSGLLLSDLSSPVDKKLQYKVEICAANCQSIFLSGLAVWKDNHYVGIKITRYHLDSKEIFNSLIDDLKATTELVELLDNGWLDDLFKDESGKELKVQYC